MKKKPAKNRKSMLWIIFTTWLIQYSEQQCQSFQDLCQSPEDDKECKLKTNPPLADCIELDLTNKSTDYKISGVNCTISSKGTIKIFNKNNDSSNIFIVSNCVFNGTDISIDLPINSETKIALSDNSKLDTSATIVNSQGDPGENGILCYSGCLSMSKIYGPVIPDYDFSKGDSPEIQGKLFKGTGLSTRFEKAGGRIFLRSKSISLKGNSKIMANAFLGDVDKVKGRLLRGGTGGAIFLAFSQVNIESTQISSDSTLINARGSKFLDDGSKESTESISKGIIGGGGRIYVKVIGSDPIPKDELFNFLSVSGYKRSEASKEPIVNPNAGTISFESTKEKFIQIKNDEPPSEKTISGQTIFLAYTKICETEYKKFSGFSLSLINSNVTELIEESTTLKWNSINSERSSYFLTSSQTQDSEGVSNFIDHDFKDQEQDVLIVQDKFIITEGSQFLVNFTQLSKIKITNTFQVDAESSVLLLDQTLIEVDVKNFIVSQNSMIASYTRNDQFSINRPAKGLIVHASSFELIENSIIKVDKLLIKPTSNFKLINSSIENLKSSCPSFNSAQNMDYIVQKCGSPQDDLLKRTCGSMIDEFFIKPKEIVQPSFVLFNVSTLDFADSMRAEDTRILNSQIEIQNMTFKNVGYLALIAKNLEIPEDMIIDSSASGCSTENPSAETLLAKYMKVCKVQGGSNLGRGTLGKAVNLELCKFLLPHRIGEANERIPIPVRVLF